MRKQTRSLAASSVAVAAFLLLAPAARAVDIQSGDSKTLGPQLRKSYVSSGNGIGTFKVGRLFGVFGSDAIANDMTLNGVGSAAVRGGGNSSLGRIGVGYLFAGFYNQIQYTTPDFNALSFTGSVIPPFPYSSPPL